MRLFKTLLLLAILGTASTALADWTAKFDELVKSGKYLTAATTLRDDKAAFESPEGIRRYVHLLVTYDAAASNYHAFALRDLKPGETDETLRKFPGEANVVETDLETVVYERYTSSPDDPVVNYAVGEYLSRMYECGCGTPRLFVGDAAPDLGYFVKAHDGGVFDGWSLFRIGLGHQAAGDLNLAIPFYRRSLEASPQYLSTAYNLAVALFLTEKTDEAAKVIAPIVDKYQDDSRNSDTHHLLARIAEVKNDPAEAEAQYKRALALEPTHENAAADYMEFLKKAGRDADYVALVKGYLANDWSSPGPFNVYIDYLQRAGAGAADSRVYDELAGNSFTENEKKGSFNYGMGRLALLLRHPEKALERYRLSLSAFEAMTPPPEGSVEAVKSLMLEATAAQKKEAAAKTPLPAPAPAPDQTPAPAPAVPAPAESGPKEAK